MDDNGEKPRDRHLNRFVVRLPDELRPVVERMRLRFGASFLTEAVVQALVAQAKDMGILRK